MQKRLKPIVLFVSLAGALLLLAGCSKKTAKVTPPNPPAPTAPTATLAANPSVIQQGQSTILSWQTNNASDISVEELGTTVRDPEGGTEFLDDVHTGRERPWRHGGRLGAGYCKCRSV